MKQLRLQRNKSGKRQKYEYKIFEGTQLLCTRRSNREYIAAYAVQDRNTKRFSAPYFFSRPDLIGRGNSSQANVYGLALLPEVAGTDAPLISVNEAYIFG